MVHSGLLAVTVLLATASVCLSGCAPGYTPFFDGRCFQEAFDTGNLQYAVDTCTQRNGLLISIHSALDNERLKNVTTERQLSFFIGLKCNTNSGQFEWMDGSDLDYTNFENAPSSCQGTPQVLFSPSTGKWHAYQDAGVNGFVCEYVHDDEYPCDQFFTWIQDGEQCVIPMNYPSAWGDAEQSCIYSYEGSHLVSIHSDGENEAIRSFAFWQNFTAGIHIGLKIVDGSPVWNDATAADYTNYSPSMPITQFGSATAMRMDTGKWLSVHEQGLDALPYFCALPANDPQTTVSPPGCPDSPYLFVDGNEKQDFYSPGFPLYVPAGTTCDYYLATNDPSQRVLLEFSTFELNTCCDRVQVFDGVLSDQPIDTLTGVLDPGYQIQTYQSNIMHIQITANDGVGVRGFHGKFSGTNF